MITFDDGYADNHDLAAPILRRAGVPATFFVATAFPDSGTMFWWDRVALMMRRCAKDFITLAYPTLLSVEPRRDPTGAAERVCRAVMRSSPPDLPRLWEELERATGVLVADDEQRAIAARTIMSWDQIRALHSSGFDVQSHSHDHLILSTLSPEAVKRDLDRSADMLRQTLRQDAQSIAYPAGQGLLGMERRGPAEARFKLGFTNDTGLYASSERFDPLNVPRISMDPEDVGAMYKLLLLEGGELRGKSPARAPSFSGTG